MLYKIYYWIFWLVFRLSYNITVYGREKVPLGAALLCGNHTSMADPLIVALEMKRGKEYNRTKFMAKIELSRIPVISRLIRSVMIYIDRGNADMGAIKETIKHLKDGGKIIIFPEGTRVGADENVQAKTGVAMMALRGGAPIVPVYITPCSKPLLSRRKIDVVFGEPFMAEKEKGLSTAEAYRKITDDLMERIHMLGEVPAK